MLMQYVQFTAREGLSGYFPLHSAFSEQYLPRTTERWRIFDVDRTKIDGEIIVGSPVPAGGWNYYGKSYTLQEIKKQFPCNTIQIMYMENNGWKTAVRTVSGVWYQLFDDDKVMDPPAFPDPEPEETKEPEQASEPKKPGFFAWLKRLLGIEKKIEYVPAPPAK